MKGTCTTAAPKRGHTWPSIVAAHVTELKDELEDFKWKEKSRERERPGQDQCQQQLSKLENERQARDPEGRGTKRERGEGAGGRKKGNERGSCREEGK